jgi:hypothetical protein
MPEFTVRVDEADLPYLLQLTGEGWENYSDSVAGVLEQLAHAAADGIRRPGSWERGWIQQATGWQG